MTWQSNLADEISKICQVDTISFGKRKDKDTWNIVYKNIPTEEQLIQIKQIIDSYDVNLQDIPEKSEIDLLKERIAALEAKTTTTTGTQK